MSWGAKQVKNDFFNQGQEVAEIRSRHLGGYKSESKRYTLITRRGCLPLF